MSIGKGQWQWKLKGCLWKQKHTKRTTVGDSVLLILIIYSNVIFEVENAPAVAKRYSVFKVTKMDSNYPKEI